MSSTNNSQKPLSWQKLDHRKELIFSDPLIRRDEQLLNILKQAVRDNILRPNLAVSSKIAPSLYRRYRGTGFPLTRNNNSPFPRWRDISSWMKVQVGLFVLADGDFVHFQIGLHDESREEQLAKGNDLKIYLRDRIARCFRNSFEFVPYYFLLLEDRDKTGNEDVTVHGHGSIKIPRCPLPKNKRGNTKARYKKIELREGTRAAELAYGKDLVRKTLRQAAGLHNRPTVWKGKSQVKRLWLKKPDNPIFNDNWGNYAFKNVRFDSALLDENRLVFSQKFKSEVSSFWKLITKGDNAVANWLTMPRIP